MYKFDSRIRYSEVGPNGLLTMEGLINYFQDCSTFQSEDLGIGIRWLTDRHIAWLVNFWQIEVTRYPSLAEKVRIGTSPYEIKSILGLRNFLMETEDGEMLAQANSVWTLFDTEKGLPVRVPAEITDKYEMFEPFEMTYLPRKIPVPKEGGQEAPKIVIQEHHLDTNRHVNNGQYVRLALQELAPGAAIRQLLVEYRRQAVLGDIVTPVLYDISAADRTDPAERCTLVSLDAADGRPYAVVRAAYTAAGGQAE